MLAAFYAVYKQQQIPLKKLKTNFILNTENLRTS